MYRHYRHLIAVLLLLLFSVEAGATILAGLHQCEGRCGCCDQIRHGSNRPHAMPHPPVGEPIPQMGGAAQAGCCMPSVLPDCDQDAGLNVALVSTPPPNGKQDHLNPRNFLTSANALVDDGAILAYDPYGASLLARASAIPIYLQTAVFLC